MKSVGPFATTFSEKLSAPTGVDFGLSDATTVGDHNPIQVKATHVTTDANADFEILNMTQFLLAELSEPEPRRGANMTAQGNALGNNDAIMTKALKGRNKMFNATSTGPAGGPPPSEVGETMIVGE